MHLTQTHKEILRSVAREIDGVVNESILKKMITKKKIYQLTNQKLVQNQKWVKWNQKWD
jgi:hypothetical protein